MISVDRCSTSSSQVRDEILTEPSMEQGSSSAAVAPPGGAVVSAAVACPEEMPADVVVGSTEFSTSDDCIDTTTITGPHAMPKTSCAETSANSTNAVAAGTDQSVHSSDSAHQQRSSGNQPHLTTTSSNHHVLKNNNNCNKQQKKVVRRKPQVKKQQSVHAAEPTSVHQVNNSEADTSDDHDSLVKRLTNTATSAREEEKTGKEHQQPLLHEDQGREKSSAFCFVGSLNVNGLTQDGLVDI